MFGRDKDKDQDRTAEIQGALSGIAGVQNLAVRRNGQIYEIHGQVPDVRTKTLVFQEITDRVKDNTGVINFLNIQATEQQPKAAGMQFPDAQTAGQAGTTTSSETRTHKVKKGETLSHISQHYYGKASQYMKIFNANKDQLNDPDKIQEGMTLKIPQ